MQLKISKQKHRVQKCMGFLGGSVGKESACNAGDLGLIPGLRRSSGGRAWQPTPVFLPGESQGQGNLVGFHLWGCTESDTTEATQQQQQFY